MDHLYYNLKCYNIRYLYKSEFKFYLIIQLNKVINRAFIVKTNKKGYKSI